MTLLLAALLVQDSTRLIRDLADERFDVRDAATSRLVELGEEKAARVLERALKHRDPEVRVRARAVRRVFDWPKVRQEVEAMIEAVRAMNWNRHLVKVPVTHFEKVTPSDPAPPSETVESWIKDLASDSPSVREAATQHLRNASSHVEAPLQEAAASRDREVAYRALALLRGMWRLVEEEDEEEED